MTLSASQSGRFVEIRASDDGRGGHYLSGFDTRRVFACGSGPMRLRVRWRNGAVTEIEEVKPNRLYEIDEALVQSTTGVSSPSAPASAPPLFADVSELLGHTHHENLFDDFERQPLLPRKLSQPGPGLAWFDLDQDGWEDHVMGSGKGGAMAVFRNQQGKGFVRDSRPEFAAALTRDQTAVLGWNRGPGQTSLLTALASWEEGNAQSDCVKVFGTPSPRQAVFFPGHTASVGPLALADMDGDGDLDLFVGIVTFFLTDQYSILPSHCKLTGIKGWETRVKE